MFTPGDFFLLGSSLLIISLLLFNLSYKHYKQMIIFVVLLVSLSGWLFKNKLWHRTQQPNHNIYIIIIYFVKVYICNRNLHIHLHTRAQLQNPHYNCHLFVVFISCYWLLKLPIFNTQKHFVRQRVAHTSQPASQSFSHSVLFFLYM